MSDLDSAPTRTYSNLLETLTGDVEADAATLVLPTPTEVLDSQPPEAKLALKDKEPAAPAASEATVPAAETTAASKATVPAAETPAASQASVPAAETPELELKITTDMMKMAKENFARAHNVDVACVSEKDIYASGKAVEWSTKHMDMTARGPAAQSMARAFRYRPEVKAMYAILLDSLKVDFRRAWASSKDFEFVKSSRSTVHSFRKRKDEVGSFKTQLQIQLILGGEHAQAREQAQNYVNMCIRPDLKVH